MIRKDAFAPSTHLVDKSVNEIRSAEHEGYIRGERDGQSYEEHPTPRLAGSPAEVGPDAARTLPARWRQQRNRLGTGGWAARSVSANGKEVGKGFRTRDLEPGQRVKVRPRPLARARPGPEPRIHLSKWPGTQKGRT